MTDAQTLIAKAMTEVELFENVRAAARLYGWLLYHTRDSHGSTAGFPDMVLARPGHILFLELKRENRNATPAQEEWLGILETSCVEGPVKTFLWRPSDWLEGRIQAVLQQSWKRGN